MKGVLDKITLQNDKFIEKFGADIFNRCRNLKNGLAREINKSIKCDSSQCVKKDGIGVYFRGCNVCEKTKGAYRISTIVDILSKEDCKNILEKFNYATGFHTSGIGCRLNVEHRSFVCVTYYCDKNIVSNKASTMIGLYTILLSNYKKAIDNKDASKIIFECTLASYEAIFKALVKEPEDTLNYSSYASNYTAIRNK